MLYVFMDINQYEEFLQICKAKTLSSNLEKWAKYLNLNNNHRGKMFLTLLVILEVKMKTISFFCMLYWQTHTHTHTQTKTKISTTC